MNLLIAIMGDTFSRVNEATLQSQLKEQAQLMSENEAFFNRDYYFSNKKYIILVDQEKTSSAAGEWLGQTDAIKQCFDEKTNQVQDRLKDLEVSIREDIQSLKVQLLGVIQDMKAKADMVLSVLEVHQ